MTATANSLTILNNIGEKDFQSALARHGCAPLMRKELTTLQINVGKLCNQACHHCHVEAGPKRKEIMPHPVARRILDLLEKERGINTVDITGGAPELCPEFPTLVRESRRMGKHVIDRCNLTILFEPGMEGLAEFLTGNQVEIIASLPCYLEENVDKQRGRGVHRKSIRALQLLNSLGYGLPGSKLALNLVYNPLGPSLPPQQGKLEAEYKRELKQRYGIEFHRLFTITNMPIKRFAEALARSGETDKYMALLANHFNAGTVEGLMCRSLVSVGWDGRLYDCDFNQMLDMGLEDGRVDALNIWQIESLSDLAKRSIAVGSHCFGCTAGAGSSCGGSLQ